MNIFKCFALICSVFGVFYAMVTYNRIFYSDDQLTRNNDRSRNEITVQNKRCVRYFFKDILLVIVYNHPHYDSVELLRQFYGPVFPHIFFCGSKGNTTKENNVHYTDIRRGIFGYKCLAEAIRQNYVNSDFKGYFYINDDVILNFWNLLYHSFDKNLIWSSNNQYGFVDLKDRTPNNWYWWVSPYGFLNCKEAVKDVSRLAMNFTSYKNLLTQYLENGNRSFLAYNGRSDILYLPRKYALKFQELSKIFEKQMVFLEIAIPTMLQFLAPSEEIKTLRGHYIPGDVRKGDPRVIDARYFWTTYLKLPSTWFIHPFKLHHEQDKNRELNLALIQHILIQKSKSLATSCAN